MVVEGREEREGRGRGDALVDGKTSCPFSSCGFCSKILNQVFSVPASGELAAGEAGDIITSRYYFLVNVLFCSEEWRGRTPGW